MKLGRIKVATSVPDLPDLPTILTTDFFALLSNCKPLLQALVLRGSYV